MSSDTYTPIGLFNRGRGIFHKAPTIGADLGDSTFSWVEEGDLVLSGQFAWEGATAIAGPEDSSCIASHHYHLLRMQPDYVEAEYLFSFLRTDVGQMLLNENSRGAAGRNRPLNASSLLKEKIPIPPKVEQKRIVDLVALERRLSEAVVSMTRGLRDFRFRLVGDIVTGKLDVRDIAANLPDDGPVESIDDARDLDNPVNEMGPFEKDEEAA